jgi:hypothetical protein
MALDAFPPVLRRQAEFCRSSGSPFTAALLDIVGADLEAQGPVTALLAPWADADAERFVDDAVSLRLAAAFHHRVLCGAAPDLARLYPPHALDNAALAWALGAVAVDQKEALVAFLGSPPQTNEVMRCLALLPGFLAVAAETGLPLTTLEIGASAGLNMNWSRFRYTGDGWAWGDPASPLVLAADWRGPPPPVHADPRPVAALGCDVAPVDVRDPDQALRLRAFVWPDQADRLARLEAAVRIAVAHGVPPDRADAGAWVEAHLRPQPGRAVVLYHSVVRQYLGPQTAGRVDAALAAAAAAATPEAPVAWLRMEPASGGGWRGMEVRLTLWPGGEDRLVARAHPHGAWVEPLS